MGFTACHQNERIDNNIGEMIAGKTYTYEKGGFMGDFDITINDDGANLVFQSENSSNFTYIKVADGARFLDKRTK